MASAPSQRKQGEPRRGAGTRKQSQAASGPSGKSRGRSRGSARKRGFVLGSDRSPRQKVHKGKTETTRGGSARRAEVHQGPGGSAESSSAGSTTPRISWALFNSPAGPQA